jgi:hypothetical protein
VREFVLEFPQDGLWDGLHFGFAMFFFVCCGVAAEFFFTWCA